MKNYELITIFVIHIFHYIIYKHLSQKKVINDTFRKTKFFFFVAKAIRVRRKFLNKFFFFKQSKFEQILIEGQNLTININILFLHPNLN